MFSSLRGAALLALISSGWAPAAATCETCHKKQVQHYAANTMSRALYAIGDSIVAQGRFTFQLGRFRYVIDSGRYEVTDGMARIDVPLRYAFGQGFAGQTYVYQHEGRWYESRISYYKEIQALDLTMGAPPGEPRTLLERGARDVIQGRGGVFRLPHHELSGGGQGGF